MESQDWLLLQLRRAIKDCRTRYKIGTQELKVDYKKFIVSNSYNTRNSNIRFGINTDAMQSSFFSRTMLFKFKCCLRQDPHFTLSF